MPSEAGVIEFKDAFAHRHPILENVYSVADVVKLMLEQPGDVSIQNRYYNGWTHDHYVTNVIVFSPNVRVIACALNAPGCLHDSTVAGYSDMYEKLEQMYEITGGRCIVDSAFCRARYPFLIKSGQDSLTRANTSRELRE